MPTTAAPLRRRAPAAALALGVVIAAIGLVAAPAPAHAASFTVTTTADVVDAATPCYNITAGALPGPDGVVSLREAVCAANRTPGNDTLTLPAGDFALGGAAGDDFAVSGDLDVWDDILAPGTVVPDDGLTIVGAGSALTVITAAPGDRVFDVVAFAPILLAIDGVTLRGGAVAPGDGGAIQSGFGSRLELTDVVIEDGSAAHGGAIANLGGELMLLDTQLSGNSATVEGGGIFSDGPVQMQRSTIADNTAPRGGGLALASAGSDVLTIEQSTVSGNSATATGGGIELLSAFNGQLVVTDTTIVDNAATTAGGGVRQAGGSAGELVMASATVTGNAAATGGGVAQVSGAVILRNTIVAENAGADVSGAIAATTTLLGVAGGGIVDGASGNRAGTAAAPLDPRLRALGAYGGPTPTRVPLPGSPAIDAGVGCGAIDQRQISRPQGAACDLGAVELTAAPDTAFTSTPAAATAAASASFAFAGTGGTGALSFECSLSGAAYQACTSPTVVSGLSAGAHTLSVRAVDELGAADATAATYTWTVAAGAVTEIADTGAAEAGTLLAGAFALLAAGGVLLATRRRARRV